MWRDFAAALCLVLVVEGMLPFLSPQIWRGFVARLATVDDGFLRVVGLVMMLLGTGLLFVVR